MAPACLAAIYRVYEEFRPLVPLGHNKLSALYLADGTNHKIWIMQRDSMEIVGSFGQNVRAVAVHSKGNLFTTEASENKRVQKFVPAKGSKRASRQKLARGA